MTWALYVVRCADDSLYCGITTDVGRRLREHNTLRARASAYCWSRRPVRLEYTHTCCSHADALREEHAWKKQTKTQKETFLQERHT